MSNQIQKTFKEPRLLVISDSRIDHQAVTEASYVGVTVISFVNTESPLKLIDIGVPCNNKGERSIGVMWWMLAREILRGKISRQTGLVLDGKEIMPDLYFYRDPNETEKEETEAHQEITETQEFQQQTTISPLKRERLAGLAPQSNTDEEMTVAKDSDSDDVTFLHQQYMQMAAMNVSPTWENEGSLCEKNCYDSGTHRKDQCPCKKNCANCNKRHHTTLCWSDGKSGTTGTKSGNDKVGKNQFFEIEGMKPPNLSSPQTGTLLSSSTPSDTTLEIVNNSIHGSNRTFGAKEEQCTFGDNTHHDSIENRGLTRIHSININTLDEHAILISRIIDPEEKFPFMALKSKSKQTLVALVDSGASTTITSSQTAMRINLRVVGDKMLQFKGFVTDSSPELCTFYEVEMVDSSGRIWTTKCPRYHGMNVRFTFLKSLEQFNGKVTDVILGNNVLGKFGSSSGYCQVEEW